MQTASSGDDRPMITVFDLELVAEEGCALPWFAGYESRAALLSAVREVDESLAGILHDGVEYPGGRGRRSVVVIRALRFSSGAWSVVGGRSPRRFPAWPPVQGARVVVQAGAVGELRALILRDDYVVGFMQALTSRMGKALNVASCPLKVTSVKVSVQDPLKVLESGDGGWEGADLRFVTPTYLNPLRGDMEYKILYPDPLHMIASAIATARFVTGKDLPKPEELADQVYISGLDIETVKVEKGEQTPTGFTGWAKLRPKKEADKETKKLIQGLLKLAEITGIGGNKSAGYGEIKTQFTTTKKKNNQQTTTH